MKAEITYNGGKSCLLFGVSFKEGITRTVSDPDLIKRCQQTAGFAVHVLTAKEAVKEPAKKVVVPVESVEEEAPKGHHKRTK